MAQNNPPVANVDSVSVKKCMYASVNVVANDTDPDGDYPLTVIAVTSSSLAQTYVESATSIGVTAYGTLGTSAVTYTVKDSRGATSTGQLSITVTNGTGCN